jgi:hypothetical protein
MQCVIYIIQSDPDISKTLCTQQKVPPLPILRALLQIVF